MGTVEQQVADLQRQVRKLQAQASGQAGPAVGGVSSFNNRRGYVTLTLADLTALLTYVASFNGRDGDVTLTVDDVTDVLGGYVESFGGRTGAVVLEAADIVALGGQLVPTPPLTAGKVLTTDGAGGTLWA